MSVATMQGALVTHLSHQDLVVAALGVGATAGSAAVIDAARRRMWPDLAPATAGRPMLVHRVVGTERPTHLAAPSLHDNAGATASDERAWPVIASLEIACIGRTAEEAAALADAVRIGLALRHARLDGQGSSGAGDVWVQSAVIDDERSEHGGAEAGFVVHGTAGADNPPSFTRVLEARVWYQVME